MKTKYKTAPLLLYLLFTFMSFVFFITAFYCLTSIACFSISISLFFLFLSITIFLIMIWGQEIKHMKICKNKLVLKQILGFSHHEYAFTDIIGYKTAILKNKNGECLQLLIKTNAEKIIEFNGFLISNINEISKEIKKTVRFDNSINEPIVNFKDKLFVLLTISLLICFLGFIFSLF
jgi:hypothetical protein